MCRDPRWMGTLIRHHLLTMRSSKAERLLRFHIWRQRVAQCCGDGGMWPASRRMKATCCSPRDQFLLIPVEAHILEGHRRPILHQCAQAVKSFSSCKVSWSVGP